MKKLYEFFRYLEKTMLAITFAEAGDHKTAKEIMKKKGKLS